LELSCNFLPIYAIYMREDLTFNRLSRITSNKYTNRNLTKNTDSLLSINWLISNDYILIA